MKASMNIMESGAEKVSRMDVYRRYQDFNSSLFDGKLPNINIDVGRHRTALAWVRTRVDRRTREIASMEMFFSAHHRMTNEEIDALLIHEMIHVKMMMDGHTYEDHGPRFQAEKKRIEAMGYEVADTHTALSSDKDGRDLIYVIVRKSGGDEFLGAVALSKEKEVRAGAKEFEELLYKGNKAEFYRAKHPIGKQITCSRSFRNMSYYEVTKDELADLRRSGDRIASVEGKRNRESRNEAVHVEEAFYGDLVDFMESRCKDAVEVIAYHATNRRFDGKRPRTPLFLSDDPGWVKPWGERLLKYDLKLSNPMRIENEGMHFEILNDPKEIRDIKDEGYDGVVITNDGMPTIYMAFDLDQIRFLGESKSLVESVESTTRVYHGTSESKLPSIMRSGIRPGLSKGMSSRSDEDFVYVTKTRRSAMWFASNNTRWSDPVVIAANLSGKILETSGSSDMEAFDEACRKLGVPYVNDERKIMDLKKLRQAMVKNGYGGISYKDRQGNGGIAIAALPESLAVAQHSVEKKMDVR